MLPYKFITVTELKDLIDYEKPVMCDTETLGFYGKIRLLQAYQRGWDFVAFVEWPNPMELISVLTKAHTVWFNAHYDISTTQYNIGHLYWQPEHYDCLFLMSRLYFFTKEKFDLASVISYTIGHNPYEEDESASDWSVPVLSESQKTYAVMDVYYLHDVWDLINETREDTNYKLDMLCLKYCLEFQTNGMPVDVDILEDLYAKNAEQLEQIGLPINCNSFKQVREYIGSTLSDDHGLAVLISQGNERAKDVRQTRKLTKQNSFMTKWMRNLRDGCIFGLFKPSARSGRTTSNDENLQQLPRALKAVFGLPKDGDTVMLISDFAQIQLRAVAVIAPDRTMEQLFRAGEDLHNFVAKMIFGENFTKSDRQIAKTSNFSLLFGAGITVLKGQLLKDSGMWLEDAEASKIKNKWLNLWKGINAWQKRGIRDWKKGVAWETPLGRRYVSKMMTDQLANQIQGFEAEVAKLAMHYMLPKLKELDERILFRDFIHDGYIFTAPNEPELYKKAAEIIAHSMQDAWIEMCDARVEIDDLPMPVEVKVGWNWGAIEGVDKAKDPVKYAEHVIYDYAI